MIDYVRSTLGGLAWVSTRKSLPRSTDDTEIDFEQSREWQRYLREDCPERAYFIMVVDDRKRFLLRSHDTGEWLRLSIGVPAEMFLGDESKQDVYRAIKLRAYTWASEKFGWPAPPPLPPLTAKRTYRKNYTPPVDRSEHHDPSLTSL